MNTSYAGWITAGFIALILIILGVLFGLTYSEMRQQLADSATENQQMKTQLEQKSREVTDLESRNSGLTSDLEVERRELSLKLEQVKKLQGSLQTVGRCLIGVSGAIDAMQKDDPVQARQALFLIQTTCEESGRIIRQVETFKASQPMSFQ